MEKTLALLKFKCWYYETAIKDGNEDGINAMLPDKLPEEIQKLYDIHTNNKTTKISPLKDLVDILLAFQWAICHFLTQS